jgi:hypothetical protein
MIRRDLITCRGVAMSVIEWLVLWYSPDRGPGLSTVLNTFRNRIKRVRQLSGAGHCPILVIFTLPVGCQFGFWVITLEPMYFLAQPTAEPTLYPNAPCTFLDRADKSQLASQSFDF